MAAQAPGFAGWLPSTLHFAWDPHPCILVAERAPLWFQAVAWEKKEKNHSGDMEVLMHLGSVVVQFGSSVPQRLTFLSSRLRRPNTNSPVTTSLNLTSFALHLIGSHRHESKCRSSSTYDTCILQS